MCFFFLLQIGQTQCDVWLRGKESASHCRRYRRHQFNHWSGRSPGVGNGNLLQYSCLEKSTDRGAWQDCSARGLKDLDTTEHIPLSIRKGSFRSIQNLCSVHWKISITYIIILYLHSYKFFMLFIFFPLDISYHVGLSSNLKIIFQHFL